MKSMFTPFDHVGARRSAPGTRYRARRRAPLQERASIIARLMATYLGNASLSTAVKERVHSTFQQAVTLFKQGRADEVIQGCTLILRMDPMFDPAKKLMEKARNPAAPIDVDALLGGDDKRL